MKHIIGKPDAEKIELLKALKDFQTNSLGKCNEALLENSRRIEDGITTIDGYITTKREKAASYKETSTEYKALRSEIEIFKHEKRAMKDVSQSLKFIHTRFGSYMEKTKTAIDDLLTGHTEKRAVSVAHKKTQFAKLGSDLNLMQKRAENVAATSPYADNVFEIIKQLNEEFKISDFKKLVDPVKQI